jgi:thiamine biosynthesis lipoprotein
MSRHTFVTRAWSSTMRLVVDDPRVLSVASADLTALLDRVEAAASRFRADSALSIANARAGRPSPVPSLLVELVDVALKAAADTDGLVDPTLGRVMNRIGYDRDIRQLTDGDVRLSPPSHTWHDVQLHRAAGLLTVPPGAALDLGATAKAFTADLAASSLARRYGTPVLVELGGDVAVAGERPGGWCIDVAEREGDQGQLIVIKDGGVATSTTTIRRWRRGDRDLHHIVDPRTGAPTQGRWRTVSVFARSALQANTASTAAIVLGEDAPRWLEGRGLAARLVDRDGAIVTTAGWPVPTAAKATSPLADVAGAR